MAAKPDCIVYMCSWQQRERQQFLDAVGSRPLL